MPTPSKPPNRRRKADEYRERDLAVLRHIYRYGIGLNAVIAETFFGGNPAGHVMRRFAAKNWLDVESGAIPGGVSFATLTTQGGKEIGRVTKPKGMGAAAIDVAIATVVFATLTAERLRRRRLLPDELKAISKGLPTNVPHVVTDEFGTPAILRIQLAAIGKPASVRQKAADFFEKAAADARTAPLVHSRELGLAVLGHTPERVKQLQKAFAEDDHFGDVRLMVGHGPTAETLAKHLRSLQRGKS